MGFFKHGFFPDFYYFYGVNRDRIMIIYIFV